MKNLISYILLNGIRDKLYIGIFFTLAISFSLSIFLGQTSLVEQSQISATFIAASSRFILIFGLILFVCISINRAFENKEIEFIISKPISRAQFILSYLIGFFLSAILIIAILTIFIFLFLKLNEVGFIFFILTLLCEIFIVISFALLCSLIFKNSFVAILSSSAFYLISRLMATFVIAINLPQNLMQTKSHFLEFLLKIISIFFPRLDLFAQSSWLIYGIEDFVKIKIIFLQSLIYIPLLIFMSFVDFKNKQF